MASPFTLSCESDFFVFGFIEGEGSLTPVRVLTTLITVSVTSAWCSKKKIKTLSLFFSHWLSGLVLTLGFLVEDMMITVCWTRSSLEGFIYTLKFVELASTNMLAVTNLAICVNLALIVSSHRTMTRVTSISSPQLLSLLLVISLVVAAAVIPFWDQIIVVATLFFLTNPDQTENDILFSSLFVMEFIAGIGMLFVVVWLLIFRSKEVKECWKLHARIRYYFGLTLVGTGTNLALGICGTLFLAGGRDEPTLILASWISRYVHIALDTIVLYGVLGERNIDERGDGQISPSYSSRQAMSRGSSNTKPVTHGPMA